MQTATTRTAAPALSRYLTGISVQAILCSAVFVLALVLAVGVWWAYPPDMAHPAAVLLLAASVPVAAHVSLRLGSGARLYLTGASIVFIVALLSPALAIVVMAAGMGAKELTVCKRCGNVAWQVLGQVGRWMLIALAASVIVHATDVIVASTLIGGFLWVADVLTAPLVFRKRTPLLPLYRSLAAASWKGELIQYLTGGLLVPVVLLEKGDTVFVAISLGVVGLWLLMVYMMSDPLERRWS